VEDYGPSNWGRWGEDDERGTLNFITPAVTIEALSLARTGTVVSLGTEVGPTAPTFPGRAQTVHVVRYFDGRPTGYADDLLILNTHSGTHLDALSHNFLDGLMYNGLAVNETISSFGATRNAVSNVGGIVTRAILLDVARFRGVNSLNAGDAIGAEELDACANAAGVQPRPGDICLVRTGWMRYFKDDRARFDSGEPGLSVDVAPWFHRNELVALGADNGAIDVLPGEPGVRAFGLHPRIIRQQGGYLIEYLDLEELATYGRYEFLFVAAPLKVTAGCGSPLNPLAVL
jgi:kynurenine formamidase